MREKLERFDRIVYRISQAALWIIIFIGLAMLTITAVSIVSRYILRRSISWGEEVLKIMLVWFGLLSVGVIAYKREHVGVVIFKEHMPKKLAAICELISQILLLFVSALMVGIGMLLVIRSKGQFTPALRMPYAIAYSSIPFSFGLMVIYEIRNLLFELFQKRYTPDEGGMSP